MVLNSISSSNSVQHWWDHRSQLLQPTHWTVAFPNIVRCFWGRGCLLSQMSQTPSELPIDVEMSVLYEDSECSAGMRRRFTPFPLVLPEMLLPLPLVLVGVFKGGFDFSSVPKEQDL